MIDRYALQNDIRHRCTVCNAFSGTSRFQFTAVHGYRHYHCSKAECIDAVAKSSPNSAIMPDASLNEVLSVVPSNTHVVVVLVLGKVLRRVDGIYVNCRHNLGHSFIHAAVVPGKEVTIEFPAHRKKFRIRTRVTDPAERADSWKPTGGEDGAEEGGDRWMVSGEPLVTAREVNPSMAEFTTIALFRSDAEFKQYGTDAPDKVYTDKIVDELMNNNNKPQVMGKEVSAWDVDAVRSVAAVACAAEKVVWDLLMKDPM